MNRAIRFLSLVVACLFPTLAQADPNSTQEGYEQGYKIGTHIGELISQFGIYVAVLAALALILFLRRRKSRAPKSPGSDA